MQSAIPVPGPLRTIRPNHGKLSSRAPTSRHGKRAFKFPKRVVGAEHFTNSSHSASEVRRCLVEELLWGRRVGLLIVLAPPIWGLSGTLLMLSCVPTYPTGENWGTIREGVPSSGGWGGPSAR